jgi:DNA-directed RNA polymerase specialized sigma24 family protein
MSSLLSQAQFEEARTASRQAGGCTSELYEWLINLVGLAQATKTLAPSSVPSGRWDDPDAVVETVHAWLEASLLRGGLLQAFDVCESPRALSRYLERALRNWLIDQSRRRTGPRLLERAAEIMAAPPFRVVVENASVMQRWWGLGAWETAELFAGDNAEIASAAWSIADLAILRFASSERADPLLSTPDLERYLGGVLDRIGKALSGRHFDHSFRHRFPFAYMSAAVDLDEAHDLSTNTTPESEVMVADAARVAIADLTERQLRVLVGRQTETLEVLAQSLGVSRGTIDNEHRRALLKVKEASPSDDVFQKVLETVVVMASEWEQL